MNVFKDVDGEFLQTFRGAWEKRWAGVQFEAQ